MAKMLYQWQKCCINGENVVSMAKMFELATAKMYVTI
jgi:hypothetical protein